MKVNASLIKDLRKTNQWSQEHLAEVCGLGLRTIQRVEASGAASQETIRSLASVFQVDADSITRPDLVFDGYKHTQWGWVTFATMPTLSAIVLLISHFVFALPLFLQVLLIATFAVLLFLFSSMTIEVDQEKITWFYGSRFLRKSLPIAEVKACEKVRNPWWMGFGIHGYSTGWIYNVSGMLGVELELKGGSFVRLGSDEPNYLLGAIRAAKASSD